MSSRLRSRTLVALIVLAAGLGALCAALLLRQARAPVPAAAPAEQGARDRRDEEGAAPKSNNAAPPGAPARERVGTHKDGAQRASCSATCAIEEGCGLRARSACERDSCEGAVRKVNRTDFALDGTQSCAEVAVLPCEEACWKRGECTGHHETDAACTRTCTTLARQRPAAVYAESRCVIESRCPDIPVCGAP